MQLLRTAEGSHQHIIGIQTYTDGVYSGYAFFGVFYDYTSVSNITDSKS